MSFTTRPELRGTFGMVASTHWLASAAGMSVLERGGNAFDAAVATGLTLQVVEPHLNGPGGEVPALLFPVDRGEPIALCGQGVAPGAATIDRYHELGHELVPGTGVLAACVPGAFGGWLLLLEQFGTWRLEDVLAFAIGYAEHGFPLVAGIRATIDRTEELLREWPGSRDLYLPAPEVGALFRNPVLAATYRRIVDESRGGSREQELEKARRAYYEGFVAEEIDRFSAAEGGLLTGDDMARWRATLEPVAQARVPGPDGLQDAAVGGGAGRAAAARAARRLRPRRALRRPSSSTSSPSAPSSPSPTATRSTATTRFPWRRCSRRRTTTSAGHSSARRRPATTRPGIGRLPHLVEAAVTPGAGEPTRGDTVHLDVADRWGNMFSATPSGGWLQSSPVIPALGWPLGTRAQMFWLEEGLASSLRPGARPRTTLCPGLALRDGKPYLAWGTPGGDQQEQWALHVFVRHVALGLNLQEAIDAPEFHMDHLISSFYPRGFARRSVTVEERFGEEVVADLRRRGHEVEVAGPWTLGRVTAVAREEDGLLKAGANPRGMQGYAAGR